MADYSNPNVNDVLPNVPDVGSIAFNRFIYDQAADYHSSDLNVGDRIQIGVVPAGQVLIPHLTRASIPALEGATPASDYTIGTAAAPAALKGSAASETPVVLFGEDWLVPAASIGSPDQDTPIYITFITADMVNEATTGQIVFEPVTRAWRDDLDA